MKSRTRSGCGEHWAGCDANAHLVRAGHPTEGHRSPSATHSAACDAGIPCGRARGTPRRRTGGRPQVRSPRAANLPHK